MNKVLKLIITVVFTVILSIYIKDNYYIITNKIEYFYRKYLQKDIIQVLNDNEYRKKQNYGYVKINTETKIKNIEDTKNAIYTFLDAGWSNYTVRCDADYLSCTNDVKEIVQNNTYLTDLSNYVHPYNTFNKINTSFTSSGKITFKKERRYTDEQITKINQKVDEIYNNNYDPSKSVVDNIRIFHDYIINNTAYDTSNTTGISEINSSTAYGVLFDGVGICSGYTDAMQLFLEKLYVKNYRISSNTHVWNLVFVDGKWLHLDLTWDDPIISDGSSYLSHDYFLIDTGKLKSMNDKEHDYDINVYIEAK